MNCTCKPSTGIFAFLSMLLLMLALGKFSHPEFKFHNEIFEIGSINLIASDNEMRSSEYRARELKEKHIKEMIALAYQEAVETQGIASALDTFEPITIPTIVHILKDTDPSIINEAEGKEQEQIDVMNRAFLENGMGITFDLRGIRTHVNTDYWNEPCPRCSGYKGYSPMAQNTHEGDSSTLNIWFNNGPPYGYSMLGPKFGYPQAHEGVIVRHTTVMGGSNPRKNLGTLLIHEVGHWLGLTHTFQGYDCYGYGDGVADTAPQKKPTDPGVCPGPGEEYPDTCPDDEFPDPIHNYMNYIDDPCAYEFTPGQALLAHITWEMARKVAVPDLVTPDEPINVVIAVPTSSPVVTTSPVNNPVSPAPTRSPIAGTPSPTRGLRDPPDRIRPETDRLRPQPDRVRPTPPPTDPIVEDTVNCPALWPGDGTACVMMEGFNRKKCIYYEYSADSICTCSSDDLFWTCVSGPQFEEVLPDEDPVLSLADISVAVNRLVPP